MGKTLWARLRGASPYLLLVTGAVLLIVGIWASVDARLKAEEENTTARAFDRANSASRSFEQYVLSTLNAADNLTRMAIVSLAFNEPAETLRRAKQTKIIDGEIFQSLNIQDAEGNLVGSTLEHTQPFNYADRDYFQSALNAQSDDLIIGTPVISRLTGSPAIPVARRYNKPDGSFGGLVLVQVRADAFERGYKNLDLRGSDYVALVGLDGIVRAGIVGSVSALGRDVSGSYVYRHQKEAPAGSFSAKSLVDGVSRHIAYRTLEDYPLFVAFGVDAEAANGDFDKLTADFVAIGALATLLVLVFTGGLGYALREKDHVNAQLRAREEALRTLATSDYLTGLPNRATLEAVATSRLANAAADGAEVACIFMDLDNFGEINSALGHPMGDEVLRMVAKALASQMEGVGHVARIGGDEFVVLFQTENDSEVFALQLAGKLREKIEGIGIVNGTRVKIRASMGVSIFSKHANSFADLIRRADEAMSHSKKGLRGIPVLFSAEMDRLAHARLEIRNGLAEALDKSELEIFYQPKIDIESRRTVGIEALLRWRHPVHGLLSPAEYIPIAEESGLIVSIGAWVLGHACRDCAELVAHGHSVPVAVNVSALQFRQSDLVSTVAAALQAAALPPRFLELELTESMVSDDPQETIQRMQRLKEIGISLAIDDFGTGYSNLQNLRRFPVDTLKIDRSFVEDTPQSKHSCSIVLAILGLAKALDLRVVAEGVETAAQEAFLKANGCAIGQGFIYAKPMPFSELQVWLRKNPVQKRLKLA